MLVMTLLYAKSITYNQIPIYRKEIGVYSVDASRVKIDYHINEN